MTRDDLEAALATCDTMLAGIGGCSDGYCNIAGRRAGMHTNGGCRCVRETEARQALVALQRLRDRVRSYVTKTRREREKG